jgi:hypothetical protein
MRRLVRRYQLDRVELVCAAGADIRRPRLAHRIHDGAGFGVAK